MSDDDYPDQIVIPREPGHCNQEHLARLRSGVETWNQWRDKNYDVNVDLSGADLRGADLRHANLAETDLTGADLGQAMLSGASLYNALLGNANLWPTGSSPSSASRVCGPTPTAPSTRREGRSSLGRAPVSSHTLTSILRHLSNCRHRRFGNPDRP